MVTIRPKDDMGLDCHQGCFGRMHRYEGQPVQNFNQPQLEEVGCSDKGASAWL